MISMVLPPSLQPPRGLLSYLHRVLNELKAVGSAACLSTDGRPGKETVMNRILLFRPMLIWLSLLLVAAPLALNAQEGQVAPPVNVSTVREGDFAVDLEQALGVGSIEGRGRSRDHPG